MAKKKKNCLMLFKIGFLSETSAPILFCMIIASTLQISSCGIDKILKLSSKTPKSLIE